MAGSWLARRSAKSQPPVQAPSPSQGVLCPQVMATCKDGSVVPTPCDCASRGGVAGVGSQVKLPSPSVPPSPLPRVGKLPSPSPSPLPGDLVMCPQVMTQCGDGSWAPTPCDCRSRGGGVASKPWGVMA